MQERAQAQERPGESRTAREESMNSRWLCEMMPGAAREDCVLVAEIADLKGLILVPLNGLKRPPPNFSLIVRLLLLLEWPLLICGRGTT